MKLKKIMLSLVLATLLLSLGSVAWAAQSQQGRFLRGQVAAIEGTTLIVKTHQGEKTILTDENTHFRIPGVENPSIEDIEVSDRVIALGRRNEDGGFVAKVVGVPKGRRLSPEIRALPLDPTRGMPSGELIY